MWRQHKGGKQSGPSENHPQNNLYQNSFCQQILWRESPFRQKNLLMHFRAHINSTGVLSPQPTNKQLETHRSMLRLFVTCFVVLLLCLDLFLHGVLNLAFFLFFFFSVVFFCEKPFFKWTLEFFFKAFLPHGYKTHVVFDLRLSKCQTFVKNALKNYKKKRRRRRRSGENNTMKFCAVYLR